MIGRKTLKSQRVRTARIDKMFAYAGNIILISYAIFFFVVWLSYRPSLLITQVHIEGLHALDPEAAASVVKEKFKEPFLWKISRANALFYPKQNIRKSIFLLDARVAQVSASISARHKLDIVVTEYTPAFLWCPKEELSEECYFADEWGYIFARAPQYSGIAFPVYRTLLEGEPVGQFILPSDEFAKISVFFEELAALRFSPRRAVALGEGDYQITVDEPWDVLFSSRKDPKESALYLEMALRSINEDHGNLDAEAIKSIDLRFGNKVFYK